MALEIISFRQAARESGVSLSAIRKYDRVGQLTEAGIVVLKTAGHRFVFRSQLSKVRRLRDRGILKRVAASARRSEVKFADSGQRA